MNEEQSQSDDTSKAQDGQKKAGSVEQTNALVRLDQKSLALQSPFFATLVANRDKSKVDLSNTDKDLSEVAENIIKVENAIKAAEAQQNSAEKKKTDDIRNNNSKKSLIETYHIDIARVGGIYTAIVAGSLWEKFLAGIDEVFDSDIRSGESAYTARNRMRNRVEELKAEIVDTKPIEAELAALETALAEYDHHREKTKHNLTELEKRKTYDLATHRILNEQAVTTATDLARFASNNGISLDAIIEKMPDQAKPFATGMLTREALEAALNWAQTHKGDVDLPPEQLAFKQFVNRTVVPHIGSFESWASMVDDINKTGTEKREPLELLKQKHITFSGKKSPKAPTLDELNYNIDQLTVKKGEAVKIADSKKASDLDNQVEALIKQRDQLFGTTQALAKNKASGLSQGIAVNLDAIFLSSQPIETKIVQAVRENERHLQDFERLFAGIEREIDGLLATTNAKKARQEDLGELTKAGEAKNEGLDMQIGQSEFEMARRKALFPKDMPKGLRIIEETIRQATEGAAIGGAAGSFIPGAGTAAGAFTGGIIGGGKGLWKAFADSKTIKAEKAIKNELVDYLRSQKVDIRKYEKEIDGVAKDIDKLIEEKTFQESVGDEAKAIRIRNAYVARSLLRSGMQNAALLSDTCKEHGIVSLDAFSNAFAGETRVAMQRLCFGVANSNDMSLIMAEADGLSGNQLKPHERALKDFVENIMKPDIAGYVSKATKVDVISQSNLLPYGAPIEHVKGIIRDENDPMLAALIANEFGMAKNGLLDVKHFFDFWAHRHGDKQLYDAKLKDGKVGNTAPKRVNVYPPEDVARFVDLTKHAMSHGNQEIPEVSDLFLRVCAHEYFLPQAVRTAGTNNIFSENPEAPAAYPMINATVNNFIEQMSLGPIGKFRQVVGERLDNVIAQTFIDYFAVLGAMHSDDPKIRPSRNQLREAANSEDYGPVFSAYTRKITKDAGERFGLFLDIYKTNLQKHMEVGTEEDRKQIQDHLDALPDPSKAILAPDIIKPGSHKARLLAAYEDHSLENLSQKRRDIPER